LHALLVDYGTTEQFLIEYLLDLSTLCTTILTKLPRQAIPVRIARDILVVNNLRAVPLPELQFLFRLLEENPNGDVVVELFESLDGEVVRMNDALVSFLHRRKLRE